MTRTPWMVLPSARPMVAETMTIQVVELTGHVSCERVIHLQHIQREVPEAEERGVADDRVFIRLQLPDGGVDSHPRRQGRAWSK